MGKELARRVNREPSPHSVTGQFIKGYSGNPGGQTKETRARKKKVVELARECTEEAVETLREIMHDRTVQGMARVRAAEALMARGWGVPSPDGTVDQLMDGDEATVVFRLDLNATPIQELE